MKALFKTIVCLSFLASTFNLRAQEDKISGIYVDGVKVTEIDCYSFKEMEVIFPIDKLKAFDQIEIQMNLFDKAGGYSYLTGTKGTNYSTLVLNSFALDGIQYGKFKIFQILINCYY